MKIALYIEDGLQQLILTPSNKYEQSLLEALQDEDTELSVRRGKFFENVLGYVRQGVVEPMMEYGYSHHRRERPIDESTMLVLRPRKRIRQMVDGDIHMENAERFLKEPSDGEV